MPITSHVGPDGSYTVLHERTALELIHRVPLLRIEEAGTEVSVIVHFLTNPPFDAPPKCMELMFSVLVDDGEKLTHLDDGRETKPFLDFRNRDIALRVICLETIRMLGVLEPDAVTMATMTPNLPEKALRKYDAISAAVGAAGYRGGRGDSFGGDQIWMFQKL